MKLLFCRNCGDVLKLQLGRRTCECGDSRGKYLADGDSAEISGPNATVIAIDNVTLAEAITNQPQTGRGTDFKAWVFAKDYFKIHRNTEGEI